MKKKKKELQNSLLLKALDFIETRKSKTLNNFLIIIFSVTFLLLAHWYVPLRLSNVFLSELILNTFLFFIFLAPTLLFINGFFIKNLAIKILHFYLLLIPVLSSWIILFFFIGWLIKGEIYFKSNRLQEIKTKHYLINLYHETIKSDTRMEFIILRQEKEILPGILLYKQLYQKIVSEKNVAGYKIVSSKEGAILLFNNFEEEKYKLKDFIYF